MANSPKRRARHRAAGPTRTPLHDIADSISANAAPIGRGAVITALSTGMLATAAIPAISASEDNLAAGVSTMNGNASTTLAQDPISVPADAQVSFSSIEVTAVAPVVAPVERRTPVVTTSRTSDRTAPAPAAASGNSQPAAADAGPAPAANPQGGSIVEIASRYVGTPYVYGGRSPAGFDCSGFVSYVYAQVGKTIPRSTAGLRGYGTRVSAAEAKPGDLVMFSNINHVGIYAGNGMMYDAARPGQTLQYRKIFSSAVYFIRVP